MKRKLKLAILPLVILAFSFVVPIAFAPPTVLNHLIVDTIGEPMDLDPAWSYDTASAELLMNVYETLLWFNRTNMDSYVPVIATEWVGEVIDETSPEGFNWMNRWYFKIRTGVKYHYYDGSVPGEGATLTPADVEYSFERMLITDCSTGPAWMIWEPLTGGYWIGHLSSMLDDLGWPTNTTTGWNTKCDEAIDHTVESNSTHVWFNLVMPYEPWLQIVAQQWGSILNKEWCVWHNDWPGMQIGDAWADYTDPLTSPLYSSDPSAPGPNLDAALGTGPYMMDYWNKGVGNAWSVVKNDQYWRTWTTPFDPEGWGTGFTIQAHVDRFSSYYIPEWSTRRLRFLGGVSDFCAVPREYMGQVDGQPGIECYYPLPLLSCAASFMSMIVDDTSTHMGIMTANGTFSEYGAPPNLFNDTNVRLGFTHLFDYATFLYASYLNESIAPVTPIVPGLSYYNASIGKAEEPAINQRKEYGITGEPAGQKAYDLTLAKTYLQAAWGGQLWATGFTIDLVYNEGNTARLMAATLVQDALNELNAMWGTKFHANIVSIPWSIYKLEWRARQLPYFIVGWLADYPDAHNFAHPFMHSTGAFSRWQGIVGVTDFPNAFIDGLIASGIASLNPITRQGIYNTIQQAYVDLAPGWVLSQPTGRHWQRDWVEGWYYNPIYPGTYAFDIWKAIGVTVQDVDVAVADMTSVSKIVIGLPAPEHPNMTMCPPPGIIDVDVARLDSNTAVALLYAIIGVGLRNETSGREVILGIDSATLGIAGGGSDTYTATFDFFEQDPDAPIEPGTYTLFAEVLVMSGFANDINTANNRFNQAGMAVLWLQGDVNYDFTCDMVDISMLIDWFMTAPTHPSWDIRGDVNEDDSIDMVDISIAIDNFMTSITC